MNVDIMRRVASKLSSLQLTPCCVLNNKIRIKGTKGSSRELHHLFRDSSKHQLPVPIREHPKSSNLSEALEPGF